MSRALVLHAVLLPALAAATVLCQRASAQVEQVNVSSPLQRAVSSNLPGSGKLSGALSELTSNADAWALVRTAEAVRLVGVPLGPARDVTLVLHRVRPFAPDAVIIEVSERQNATPRNATLVERRVPIPQADYFAGFVEGDPESRVMLTSSAAGVHGYVNDRFGVAIISTGPPGGRHPIVSYSLSDLPSGAIEWQDIGCGVGDAGPVTVPEPEGGIASETPCRQVTVAVDTDYEYTALFGGNTAASAAYAGTLFAGALDVFARDLSARPQVTYLRLWTTPNDPWTTTGLLQSMPEFQNYWAANMAMVPREVAHMLAGRQLGGGIANGHNLCLGNCYSISGHLNGYFPYPLQDSHLQNWDIWVVCHELGHNFGAPHTHAYCPPIDQCAPSGFFGACQTQQVCITNGTFMSYCHACAGAFANQQMRFHAASILSIEAHMNSVCDLTGPSEPPVGVTDTMAAVGGTTAEFDVLANDVALNCETIEIGEAPEQSTAGGAVTIVPGAGPGGRDVLHYQAPQWFMGVDALSYRLRDASGQRSGDIAVSVTVASPFDLNSDGHVSGADLGEFLGLFGTNNARADFNHDGVVSGADLGMLLSAWTG